MAKIKRGCSLGSAFDKIGPACGPLYDKGLDDESGLQALYDKGLDDESGHAGLHPGLARQGLDDESGPPGLPAGASCDRALTVNRACEGLRRPGLDEKSGLRRPAKAWPLIEKSGLPACAIGPR